MVFIHTLHSFAGCNGVRVWICGVVAFGREYVYGKAGVESCRPVSETLAARVVFAQVIDVLNAAYLFKEKNLKK